MSYPGYPLRIFIYVFVTCSLFFIFFLYAYTLLFL